MEIRRCSTEAKALCPDGRYCEENASFRTGSECDDFNQQVEAEHITEGRVLRLAQTIRWRSIGAPYNAARNFPGADDPAKGVLADIHSFCLGTGCGFFDIQNVSVLKICHAHRSIARWRRL